MPDALEYAVTLRGITEPRPGPRWQQLFATTWPAYRAWYLGADGTGRPDLTTATAMLVRHMPELVPTYRRLVDLTGRDETAARMLTLWDPPRFSPGCSQMALTAPVPALCRNYDYSLDLFEGTVLTTSFTRPVIGTGDCLWGLLDGMNDAGLVVSLAFGGRPGSGQGFGVPLVVRYLLEVAETTEQARLLLRRLPLAMAYNLTIVDATGDAVSAYLSHDGPPEFSEIPIATNHRGDRPDFPELSRALHSVERREALLRLSATDPGPAELLAAFLDAPLRNTGYSRSFGTLYTALYQPALGVVDYCWPGHTWRRGFTDPDADPDATTTVVVRESERQHVR
ncbi:C45 family autoproteolytic acyltransferase/hydolase [Pseudonocardia sp. TRM90224]|uniref:C45 family autoproteolytic acyltransferase/hydolase n=1 Tax=Pseudonocardia sp. TRM90224 TaxID=2812678 RepID=UPI001E31EC07|nr:C45 family peptidase [Pseudonocardia sp. TRM90224]